VHHASNARERCKLATYRQRATRPEAARASAMLEAPASPAAKSSRANSPLVVRVRPRRRRRCVPGRKIGAQSDLGDSDTSDRNCTLQSRPAPPHSFRMHQSRHAPRPQSTSGGRLPPLIRALSHGLRCPCFQPTDVRRRRRRWSQVARTASRVIPIASTCAVVAQRIVVALHPTQAVAPPVIVLRPVVWTGCAKLGTTHVRAPGCQGSCRRR
jgi:hypothetical protein